MTDLDNINTSFGDEEDEGNDMGNCGFSPFGMATLGTDEDYRRRSKLFTKIAKRFVEPEKIIVGLPVHKHADYTEKKIYVTVETPIFTHDLRGTIKTEGVLECEDLASLTTMYNGLYTGGICGTYLVIDKKSKKVIGTADGI